MLKSVIQHLLGLVGYRLVPAHVLQQHAERMTEARVMEVLAKIGSATVIDVGANEGQFAHDLIKKGYVGKLISFEPLAAEHERLTLRARPHPAWVVGSRCAIGDESSTATIYRAANSYSSSLLKIDLEHIKEAPHLATIASEHIRVQRLDNCTEITHDTTGTLFLKLDTQGFELHCLRGASGIMPRIAGMIIECSLIPIYEGSPLLVNILDFVRKEGFYLHDLIPGYQSQSGRMLQVDIIVLRQDFQPALA
jgi:FkbM family methyltransferase